MPNCRKLEKFVSKKLLDWNNFIKVQSPDIAQTTLKVQDKLNDILCKDPSFRTESRIWGENQPNNHPN
jgi:hypothetical protein